MLHTLFRASEKEEFWIFSTYFYDSNLGLSRMGPFCTPEPSEQTGSAEDFEIKNIYIYGLNTGPLVRGHLATRNLHFIKFGKGPLDNATYQISSI